MSLAPAAFAHHGLHRCLARFHHRHILGHQFFTFSLCFLLLQPYPSSFASMRHLLTLTLTSHVYVQVLAVPGALHRLRNLPARGRLQLKQYWKISCSFFFFIVMVGMTGAVVKRYTWTVS